MITIQNYREFTWDIQYKLYQYTTIVMLFDIVNLQKEIVCRYIPLFHNSIWDGIIWK